MGQLDKKSGLKSRRLDNIRELFYEFPQEQFTIREASKRTKIPKSTVKTYLDRLKSEQLITEKNKFSNTYYSKTKKSHYYIEKMFEFGLIDYLIEELVPEAIILFGSFRKGESIVESDIDLFVITHSKKKIELNIFEKRLKHKIELHIKTSINQLHDNLFNNVVNGIKLYGSFKVKS